MPYFLVDIRYDLGNATGWTHAMVAHIKGQTNPEVCMAPILLMIDCYNSSFLLVILIFDLKMLKYLVDVHKDLCYAASFSSGAVFQFSRSNDPRSAHTPSFADDSFL